MKKTEINKIQSNFFRIILIIAGSISTALGIIGIFLPLLPTTPFLLLAAALYARSSMRLYNWLLNNSLFGKYIKNYIDGKGIPLKAKILSISLLWLTILYSVFFIINIIFFRIILILISVAVSIHIILIRTIKKE